MTVYPDVSALRSNTVFENGGSGIVVVRPGGYPFPITIERNIGSSNQGWGLSVGGILASVTTVGCNDWFGNASGRVDGVSSDSTDLSVDPLFCNMDSEDVRLDSASPLLADSA